MSDSGMPRPITTVRYSVLVDILFSCPIFSTPQSMVVNVSHDWSKSPDEVPNPNHTPSPSAEGNSMKNVLDHQPALTIVSANVQKLTENTGILLLGGSP